MNTTYLENILYNKNTQKKITPIKSSSTKVLIVDDDQIFTNLLKHHLTKNSCIPYCTSSGEEALEMLKSEKNFDLILVDWNMEGLNGGETIYHADKKIIRRKDFQLVPTPYLTISGNNIDPRILPDVLNFEYKGHIRKSSTSDMFIQMLNHITA